MRKVLLFIMSLITPLSVFAQTGKQKEVMSILDAMSIVSHHRTHPIATEEELDGFIRSVIGKYGYREEDFLEGIGTCMFWQYIKNGHTVHNAEPLDDDYFIPDNKSLASAVAIIDCSGIETIENDETAISAEIRVFTEARRDELIKEMQDIGFAYKKTEYNSKWYTWKSYTVSISEGKSRGHNYWRFTVELETRDYASTKTYEYADSSAVHNVKIKVDYPVNGNPVLLRRARTFIMEALELDLQNGGPLMGRFNDEPSEGQAAVNYYGKMSVALLKEKHASEHNSPFKEQTSIRKVAETDYYISFEAEKYGFYGGVDNVIYYGATFRKSDGKRLKVIANPQDPKFRHFLNNDLIFEKKEDILEEYKDNIPMPKYEPYLIQSGVRFVYQQNETAPGAAEVIKVDKSFSEMYQYLSNEVKGCVR